jgi:uncharacterized integral membrane protein (TIGR00697 family)
MSLTPRPALASIFAFLMGEFANSMTLSKLKSRSPNKGSAKRFVLSTLVGQVFDTLFFVSIAFLGVFPSEVILAILLSNYFYKVAIEVIFLPLSLFLASKLKGAEKIDHVDRNLALNPFAWRM